VTGVPQKETASKITAMRWTDWITLAEQFSLKEKPAELYALKENSQPSSLGYDDFTTAVIAEKSIWQWTRRAVCSERKQLAE
jgi:hypothetical protein